MPYIHHQSYLFLPYQHLSREGLSWWKLSRVKKSEWKNRPSGWIPKSGAEIKREGITFVLGDVTKLVIADKISEGEMVSRFHELIDAFFAAVDKVKDE